MSRLATYHRTCVNKARVAKKKYETANDRLIRQREKINALQERLSAEQAHLTYLHTQRAQLLEMKNNYENVAAALEALLKDS